MQSTPACLRDDPFDNILRLRNLDLPALLRVRLSFDRKGLELHIKLRNILKHLLLPKREQKNPPIQQKTSLPNLHPRSNHNLVAFLNATAAYKTCGRITGLNCTLTNKNV